MARERMTDPGVFTPLAVSIVFTTSEEDDLIAASPADATRGLRLAQSPKDVEVYGASDGEADALLAAILDNLGEEARRRGVTLRQL